MSYRGIYSSGSVTTTVGTNTSGVLHVHTAPSVPQSARPWEIHSFYPNSPPPHTMQPYIPLPPAAGHSTVLLHRMLDWVPNPLIIYNLFEHPSTAVPNNRMISCLPRWKEEPATASGLNHFTIRIPNLDRPIVINQPYTVVTVNCILTAVHNELRNEAYQTLCSRGRGVWANPQYISPQQMEDDIHRVVTQILGGRLLWDGLTPSKTERDVWVLHVR